MITNSQSKRASQAIFLTRLVMTGRIKLSLMQLS